MIKYPHRGRIRKLKTISRFSLVTYFSCCFYLYCCKIQCLTDTCTSPSITNRPDHRTTGSCLNIYVLFGYFIFSILLYVIIIKKSSKFTCPSPSASASLISNAISASGISSPKLFSTSLRSSNEIYPFSS